VKTGKKQKLRGKGKPVYGIRFRKEVKGRRSAAMVFDNY